MNITVTETINRTPEQVFDTLIDVERHTDWASGPEEITSVSENPAQLGTTWQQRTSVLGKDLDSSLRVNVYEPGRKFGFTTDKPFPTQFTFTLEPQNGATKLTFSGEFEPGGFFKVAGPVLSTLVKGTLAKDLKSLKATLEKA